ncbi:TPA: ATP-binding protein [Stenotrophomonas maltophilia]
MQLAATASVSGEGRDPGRWRQRPLGALNHSASVAALLGDGNLP